MKPAKIAKPKKNAPAKRAKTGFPRPLALHFRAHFDANNDLLNLVRISATGIGALQARPGLVRALAKFDDRDRSKDIREAEEAAAVAKIEVESGFSSLHSFAIVAQWSLLEHTVKGVVMEWLLQHPKALENEAFEKVTVPLASFARMSRRERAYEIVSTLERRGEVKDKRGVDRFESLFSLFGLSGALEESLKKTLYEFQQVRNVIAHQNGKADKKFLKACPWIKVKEGERVKVSQAQLLSYSGAAMAYINEILFRLGDKYGVDLRAAADAENHVKRKMGGGN